MFTQNNFLLLKRNAVALFEFEFHAAPEEKNLLWIRKRGEPICFQFFYFFFIYILLFISFSFILPLRLFFIKDQIKTNKKDEMDRFFAFMFTVQMYAGSLFSFFLKFENKNERKTLTHTNVKRMALSHEK